MSPILDEKEALATRHDANAEAGELGIKNNVIGRADGKALHAPLGQFRHAVPAT
jgi:hypothetical protein